MAENTRLESAAASILQRAVTLDKNGRLTESLVCYQEGLQILVDYIKGNWLLCYVGDGLHIDCL